MSGATHPTTLTVNGRLLTVAADEQTPLLWVLREDAGCTGVRFGCGQGLCGACTVRVDGRAALSCDTPLWSAAGRSVHTVEMLHTHDVHGLLSAFIDAQAGQCGYCLPGIVMRAAALLDESPRPSRAQIVGALERHLCRCGSHGRIVEAIERAASR